MEQSEEIAPRHGWYEPGIARRGLEESTAPSPDNPGTPLRDFSNSLREFTLPSDAANELQSSIKHNEETSSVPVAEDAPMLPETPASDQSMQNHVQPVDRGELLQTAAADLAEPIERSATGPGMLPGQVLSSPAISPSAKDSRMSEALIPPGLTSVVNHKGSGNSTVTSTSTQATHLRAPPASTQRVPSGVRGSAPAKESPLRRRRSTELFREEESQFPLPSDEEVRAFCLMTGGGHGACDADDVFVIGGKWAANANKPANGGMFGASSTDVARTDSASTLQSETEAASPKWHQSRLRELGKDAAIKFHRPEGSAQGSTEANSTAEAIHNLPKTSGKLLKGVLSIQLQEICGVPVSVNSIQVRVTIEDGGPMFYDLQRCEVSKSRLTSEKKANSSTFQVTVVRKGAMGQEYQQVQSLISVLKEESLDGLTCNLQFPNTTIQVGLKADEVAEGIKGCDAYSKTNLDTRVMLDISFLSKDTEVHIDKVPKFRTTLAELHMHGWEEHLLEDPATQDSAEMSTFKYAADEGVGGHVKVFCFFRPDLLDFDGEEMKSLLGDRPGGTAFGRLGWRRNLHTEPAQYVRCSGSGLPGWRDTNPYLLRFFLERVWRMQRPKLVLSVNGGIKDFDMVAEKKENLMLGLTDAAKSLDAWIISEAKSQGIPRLVGEARARYAVSIPLIGVASWGAVKGRHKLLQPFSDHRTRPHLHVSPVDAYEDAVKDHAKKKPGMSSDMAELDRNHSHFILVHDGSKDQFRRDMACRPNLTACLSRADAKSNHIISSLQRQGIGWQGIDMRKERVILAEEIPAVLVVVQGGKCSITAIQKSIHNGVPVLVVKGSGKASDMVSDAILLQYGANHSMHVSHLSDAQAAFAQFLDFKDPRSLGSISPSASPTSSRGTTAYRDYTYAINRLENDDNLDHEELKDLFLKYFKKLPSTDIKNMLKNILVISQSPLCSIYDLDSADKQDFSGALLNCVMHNQAQDKVHSHDISTFYHNLQRVVNWNRCDILIKELANVKHHISTKSLDDWQHALDDALHTALIRNRVDIVRTLLEAGADLQLYVTNPETVLKHEASSGHVDEDTTLKIEAAKRWTDLMWCHKEDPHATHVLAFLMPLKDGSRTGRTFDWAWQTVSHDKPHMVKAMRKKYKMLRKESTMFNGKGGMRLDQALVYEERMEWIRAQKTLVKIQWLYHELLGSRFTYVMGELGPEMDLFLWSILMNRHQMAMLFWHRCTRPVQTALTACLFYRVMAQTPGIEPVVQRRMFESARTFEQHAKGVQLAAMDEDMTHGIEALEFPLELWAGMTGLDLAVAGECMDFVQSCCRESIDRRFSGDLEPYNQRLGPLSGGCKTLTFACLTTGGLIAPWLMKYIAPPKAHILRYPTQCRRIPEGYPYAPMENPKMAEIYLRYVSVSSDEQVLPKSIRWIRALHKDEVSIMPKLGAEQLNELWGPTFNYWDRFSVFWRAPVTIYLANVISQVVIICFFTNFLTSPPSARSSLHHFETFLIIFYCSSAFTESVQMSIDGPLSYFSTFWNWLDLASILAFWIGMVYRLRCMDGSCSGQHAWSYHEDAGVQGPPIESFSAQFYSVALFCLFTRLLRVLSIDRNLGPLVIVFRRMGQDTVTFMVMWSILLMAFSVAIRGSGLNDDKDCTDEDLKASCWHSWWVVRTIFQALAQPFFEDMESDSSMIVLIILWITMNIIMVNLLIARMSSTYSQIEQQSEREWMVDLYFATREYMRYTAAIPVPFNTLPLLIDIALYWYRRSRYAKDQSGLLAGGLSAFLSRNRSMPMSEAWIREMRRRRDHLQAKLSIPRSNSAALSKELDDLNQQLLVEETRIMREHRVMRGMEAFLERARTAYMLSQEQEKGSDSVTLIGLQENLQSFQRSFEQHILARLQTLQQFNSFE